ncbi:MAG: hypothetical protein EAX95_00605 [Candidatus Thorarchaeota archaeon]|nr:hypothetical protein [Candidatus Thorarchaeota archaeon]
MKILVVSSCGKKKLAESPNAPGCGELTSPESLSIWQKRLSDLCFPAREMYNGYQNQEIVKGTDNLRKVDGIDVDLLIVSAGFGLVSENTLIPPYDCSFNRMKKLEVLARSSALNIESTFKEVCKRRYDLLYLALGEKYLLSLGEKALDGQKGLVLLFHPKGGDFESVSVPSGSKAVSSFSQRGHMIHGVVGFKGDLLRILSHHALSEPDPYEEVLSWTKKAYLENLLRSLGGFQP